MKFKTSKLLLIVLSVLILTGCSLFFLIPASYPSGDIAEAAMLSDDVVTVSRKDNCIVFSPAEPTCAFVFYPGGRVDCSAYAPLLHRLASENVLCILIKMPFDLAILDMYAAEDIPEQYPQINDWYIGGHSLGGSSAAYHLDRTEDPYKGLVLLASYASVNLQDKPVDVCSLYGSEDGVLNIGRYDTYKSNLPENYTEILIAGGNHAQFGDYGQQNKDGIAAVSPEKQLDITADALLDFFQN